ncbi:hypothetical protein QUA86_00530 [Microcoleus sp. F6_B6]
MPELSRFLGITITMYYNDHPPPTFMSATINKKPSLTSKPSHS